MLQVSNVSKSFGDNLILDRVSFTVNPGERQGSSVLTAAARQPAQDHPGRAPADTGSARLSRPRCGRLPGPGLEHEPARR